jgi:hypothetical protein
MTPPQVTPSRDGTPRATVRVEYRLDLDAAVCALAGHWDFDPEETPTSTRIWQMITQMMRALGDEALFQGASWGDAEWSDRSEAAERLLAPFYASERVEHNAEVSQARSAGLKARRTGEIKALRRFNLTTAGIDPERQEALLQQFKESGRIG